MSKWINKLYEQVLEEAAIYYIVDHNVDGAQHKIPADATQYAYKYWNSNGDLTGFTDLPHHIVVALDRLFSSVPDTRLHAFFTQTSEPGAYSSTPPTSVTGGGVDISGFPLLA